MSLAAPALTSAVVHFQLGLCREMVRVPATNLSYHHAKRLAAEIIKRKAPESSVVGAGERVLLFRHQTSSDLLLKHLTLQDELQDGDLIEVVIAGSASVCEMKIYPHSLLVHSYRTPTFCHLCGEMLWGLVRQGLKCDGCGLDFHKRCAFRLVNDCSRVRRQVGTSVSLFQPRHVQTHLLTNHRGGSLEEISRSKPSSRPPSWAEPPEWLPVGVKAQVPHTFHIHSYTKPTVCQHCHRLLRGLFRQGLQCSDCRFNCHRRCEPLVPRDCPGVSDREGFHPVLPLSLSLSQLLESTFDLRFWEKPFFFLKKSLETTLTLHLYDLLEAGHSPAEPEMEEEEEEVEDESQHLIATSPEICEEEMSDGGLREVEPPPEPMRLPLPSSLLRSSPCFSSNIPLMRLVQSVHHTKRRDTSVLMQGWLLHHTQAETLRKRHYWILDPKSITLYQSESSTKYYKEISMAEVLQVRGPTQLTVPSLPGDRTHSFEVLTLSLVYCVTAGADGPAWESALRQAMMPMGSRDPQGVDASGETKDISSLYQISTDEILGSGQFGVVYKGTHRTTGRLVAIKVIDKSRFPASQERQMRNEAAIVQNLSHQGVVQLEGMFECHSHVFVVMEKLHGDMLEMILSSETGRLPERLTRFLVLQILEALRYLHFKHIAHCDLKPENVLLASADSFPQVKLCDFGFSRIIGERSFRRSVVGTPAYLAPEVISSSGYNCSLDMWSVGVIMYVSLSGTFPFNEDEDIRQQITNAAFMFPRQAWASVSLEAVSLINNLLQVSVRRRFSVGRALGHVWLQDFQLWCDLRELEQREGSRYLTHHCDDERWRRYATERGLTFPSSLCCDLDM
ncbi:protein kinase D4 [Synchiropus splendidus]|uniref:protein kinase D4 n=1 Tax=Synchiropus splendidus TaxID=270530 RepID=UPI00237DFF3F|nr:protein kinase D4 [Synchiropus splendidus]